MTEELLNYILIPKTIFWTAFISIAGALAGFLIYCKIKFVYIEKEISLLKANYQNDYKLLKLQVEKDLEILGRIEQKVDGVNQRQIDLEKKIILKQDRKFA